MTPPFPPSQLPDADLWEYYRGRGLSAEDATLHVERRRSARPKYPAPPSTAKAVALSLMQGMRPTNRPEALAELNEARFAHPKASIAANIAGAVVNPLARVLPAPTSIVGGAVTGGTLGAVQGGAEGGVPGAVAGTATGVVTGGVLGPLVGKPLAKLVTRFGPIATKVWQTTLRGFQRKGIPVPMAHAAADAAAEKAVRDALTRAGHPPEAIEQVIQAMRAGGKFPAAPPPDIPVRTRAGETLVQKGPDALRNLSEAELAAADPLGMSPPLAQSNAAPGTMEAQIAAVLPRTLRPRTPSPQDPQSAARAAHALAEAAGVDATAAARRAAGTYSNFDPRQALVLAMLLGAGQQR